MTFLKNAWYLAAYAEEVSSGPLARTLLNEPVVLFRIPSTGKAAALEDVCRHRAAPLSLGKVSAGGIECGYHGMVFDGSGACVRIPGQERVPPQARVRSYPVIERDEQIWIWMGDPAAASESLIPGFPAGDSFHRWRREHAKIDVRGSYVLMIENLMDLTHLAYVHRNSIGGDAQDHADAEIETRQTPTGVKFTRTMRNAAPPARYRARYGFDAPIDRWEEFEYVAPATVLQFSGAALSGGGGFERRDGAHCSKAMHVLTPETDRSCHYFFLVADGGRPVNKSSASQIEAGKIIFREDAAMIEQQQLRIESCDQSALVDIKSDVVRAQATRFLQQRIQSEQEMAQAPS